MGIVPREFDYLDYPYIFLSNTPGCGGHLPFDYTFISYDALAFNYTIKEGNEVVSAPKGIYYCNRNTNVPFLLDSFYEPYESKLIDNRNYLVLAPSGGGKSFSSRSRLFQPNLQRLKSHTFSDTNRGSTPQPDVEDINRDNTMNTICNKSPS